jgi:hypothetical protein
VKMGSCDPAVFYLLSLLRLLATLYAFVTFFYPRWAGWVGSLAVGSPIGDAVPINPGPKSPQTRGYHYPVFKIPMPRQARFVEISAL